MANFTIRVELHGQPSLEQYERLHQLMATFGFFRTLNGVTPSGTAMAFNLPTGTYFGTSNGSPSDIRAQVASSIKTQIQPSIILFVAETKDWAIGG